MIPALPAGRAAATVLALVLFAACASKTRRPTPTEPPLAPLFQRLGGKPALTAIVEDLVARAGADPAVNLFRAGTSAPWPATTEQISHLKLRLYEYLCALAAGPCVYQGKGMRDAHRSFGISNAQFNSFAADLKTSMDKFNVASREEKELLAAVERTRADIVEGR